MDTDKIKRVLIEMTSAVAAAAAFATILGTLSFFIDTSTRTLPLSPIETQFSRDIDKLKSSVANQQRAMEDIASRLQAITSATGQSPTDIQIASVRAELATTAKRVDGLDAAILDSPTKALSIPLLRQELKGMKANYQRDI
jgi:hypothetical protein